MEIQMLSMELERKHVEKKGGKEKKREEETGNNLKIYTCKEEK